MTTNIFEQLEEQLHSFYPRSPLEYFALRLAQKLSDSRSARHYLALVERYSAEDLIRVHGNATSGVDIGGNVAQRFHAELEQHAQGDVWNTTD